MEFRKLRADEIDCRVAQISEKGLTLLLYKDARCDMNILDETVGSLYWMRQHSRENANCTVSIWNEELKQWVSKEDTGTESNTEAEKGLASDSFKRACFNWGIGRELYTAPFVWIQAKDCTITQGRNGKPACFDRFEVVGIEYDKNSISALTIKNTKTGHIVFEWYASGKPRGKKKETAQTPPPPPKPESPKQSDLELAAMRDRFKKITLALTQGKPENIASAVSIWTEGIFVRMEDVPDDMLPSVLDKAESIYRKRGYTD